MLLKVERIPMELLLLLLQNSGKLVRREAINERLWGDGVFIEAEHGINTAINKLRATLRDDSRDPRFIRTVVGRGYCFIAEVNMVQRVEARPGADGVPVAISKGDTRFFASSNGHLGTAHAEESHTMMPTVEAGHLATDSLGDAGRSKKVKETSPMENDVARGCSPLHCFFFALAGTALLLLKQQPEHPIPIDRGPHSVAVLPFRNLARDSDQDYLVDGMTEQLITQLGKNSSLRVISYGSVMQYKECKVRSGTLPGNSMST